MPPESDYCGRCGELLTWCPGEDSEEGCWKTDEDFAAEAREEAHAEALMSAVTGGDPIHLT